MNIEPLYELPIDNKDDLQMNPPRRALLIMATTLAAFFCGSSRADDYPVRPIRLIIPFSAGGATDVVGRLVSAEMARHLGQAVIVENKVGAAGAIGTDAVAKSAPDGYTVCFCTTGPQVILPFLTKLPFDPARDLAPVVHVHNVPNVLLARTSLPAANVKELIALAKLQPGKFSYGSTGAGGPQHLAGELFKSLSHVDMVHVPYKGESAAFTDLAGDHLDTSFGSISVAEQLIKSGKIKALAVTGLQRSPALPDVATVAETIPGFSAYTFVGLNVPARTPRDVIDKLNRAANLSINTPAIREKMLAMTIEPIGGTPEAYAEFLRKEGGKWISVIQRAGVTSNE